MKEVVIIGGGFAGVNLAKGLGGKKDFHVTLVDRNNYNFFPPLLYQVATGLLEPSNISYPFRKLFRSNKNISFRMAEFKELVANEKKVVLSTGELKYDYVVFASGAATNYFGMANVKAHSLPMKTVNDAIELRNHFLENMEKAAIATDEKERNKLLTIVVAGAGPTGVEVSGMLADLRKYVAPKDYPEVAGHHYPSHICLVDGVSKVLATMSEKSQNDAYESLKKMGVEIKLGYQVKDYVNDVLTFENGQVIETKTLVWAAGVSPVVVAGIPDTSYGKGKRLLVDVYNKVQGLDDVYAIGDACMQTTDARYPKGHPQLAQVAIQQGNMLAKNFVRLSEQKEQKPFEYWDKGTMAIIGESKAVADIPKPHMHLKGFIAWMAWLFVHLTSLINFRNKIKTFYNWLGAFIIKDSSLRLIIRPSKDPAEGVQPELK